MYLRITSLILVFLICLTLPASNPVPETKEGLIQTLIIDAGHGGKDPGAIGARYYEKDIALNVALQLRRLVNENLPHVKVIMTRDKDKFIELHRRAEIAKENE